MMITTLRQAEKALAEAMSDYEADCGEPADEVWFDLVVATAFDIVTQSSHADAKLLAREFCRTQIGSIPQDLEAHLGTRDWIDS